MYFWRIRQVYEAKILIIILFITLLINGILGIIFICSTKPFHVCIALAKRKFLQKIFKETIRHLICA